MSLSESRANARHPVFENMDPHVVRSGSRALRTVRAEARASRGRRTFRVASRTRTVRRRGGDAVQQDYALGGGSSGADPDVTGIVTASAIAQVGSAVNGQTRPSACGAPSAVTQGMEATHVLCEGLEHGACSGDARSASDVAGMAISGIAAIDAGCATDGLMGAIPGVVHTTPSVTIVR